MACGHRGLLHVGSGACPTGDQAIALQRLDGLGDRDAGGAEALAKGGFTRHAIAGTVDAFGEFAYQFPVDGAMQGNRLGGSGCAVVTG